MIPQNLNRQGRVHEIQGHHERIAAIAKEYAKSPENTLVVSPDNCNSAWTRTLISAREDFERYL